MRGKRCSPAGGPSPQAREHAGGEPVARPVAGRAAPGSPSRAGLAGGSKSECNSAKIQAPQGEREVQNPAGKGPSLHLKEQSGALNFLTLRSHQHPRSYLRRSARPLTGGQTLPQLQGPARPVLRAPCPAEDGGPSYSPRCREGGTLAPGLRHSALLAAAGLRAAPQPEREAVKKKTKRFISSFETQTLEAKDKLQLWGQR